MLGWLGGSSLLNIDLPTLVQMAFDVRCWHIRCSPSGIRSPISLAFWAYRLSAVRGDSLEGGHEGESLIGIVHCTLKKAK